MKKENKEKSIIQEIILLLEKRNQANRAFEKVIIRAYGEKNYILALVEGAFPKK